jgi:hypothetical protein
MMLIWWRHNLKNVKCEISILFRHKSLFRHECSSYRRYRYNEVRLYVINMDKSKGCKLKLVPNNKRTCDAIYKYLFLDITMAISNPIRIRVNPTVYTLRFNFPYLSLLAQRFLFSYMDRPGTCQTSCIVIQLCRIKINTAR